MAQSAQVMNYGGVFTFSHDGTAETSRVLHFNDGGAERGKVAALDGPPREIIRDNNVIACYMPERHLVKLDRVEGRLFFPALLTGSPSSLRNFYNLSYAGMDRVAGRDCQMVRLEPRDGMRFGYRLCADLQTGLMLRATLEDGTRGVLQQFAFTEVEGETGADRSGLQPSWSGAGWAWDRSGLAPDGDGTWSVGSPPAGFRKVMERHRALDAGKGTQLTQLVYSDGISAVSLFIEPAHSQSPGTHESRHGAMSFYTTRIGDQQVTAVGEVPPAAVAQMVKTAAPVKSAP
jgi:sigma-E factor negative regulatory protein RseB